MKKILFEALLLSTILSANDRVIEGVVNGEIKWVKKIIMVPAPITSNIVVVQGTVNCFI